MGLDELDQRVVRAGIEYTIVRAGIVLCIFYAEPATTLAPAVAEILEKYVNFIPQGSLQTYLSADGTWKKLDKRAYNKILSKLHTIGTREYAEFHFGQEPLASVGQFGAHFKGSPLRDTHFPNEVCSLYLEFPYQLAGFTDPDAIVKFVRDVAELHGFDSGYCGYAFKH